MKLVVVLSVLSALLQGSLQVAAAATGALDRIDASARAALVERMGELLQQHYVEPDKAAEIADELQERLQRGRYDRLESPADFAGALSQDLRQFDRHFLVTWMPDGEEGSPPGGHDQETEAEWARRSRLQNFGFEKVVRLPGNLGYLDLRYFDSPAWAGETATAAMALLANVDAVIVDLRQNGGGEPGMVQLLLSYFFPEPVHYNSFLDRGRNTQRQLWTLPHVPGKRLPDAAVYVLTSARTGSAAESFAYSLQALGRATIVGENTAGAANPGETFAIGDGFSIFISTGKPVNPVTGGNWEDSGVSPDVEIAADEALEKAQQLALGALLEDETDPWAERERRWALEALRIRREPVALPASGRTEYAGTYGDHTIRQDGEQLIYEKGRRPRRRMVFLGEDRFLLAGVNGFRLLFERDESGRVVRLVKMWSDGHQETYRRN